MGTAQHRRTALLALGANLGDPLEQLHAAVARLRSVLTGILVSTVYRTAPEGGANQPDYFNAVVRGEWHGTARELLVLAAELERDAGRTRPHAGAARTLDVDLVFLGDLVLDEPGLQLPHPRWSQRAFVVVPLLDVAPDWVDPVSGRLVSTVAAERGWDPTSLARAAPPGSVLLETT